VCVCVRACVRTYVRAYIRTYVCTYVHILVIPTQAHPQLPTVRSTLI